VSLEAGHWVATLLVISSCRTTACSLPINYNIENTTVDWRSFRPQHRPTTCLLSADQHYQQCTPAAQPSDSVCIRPTTTAPQ